MASPGFLAIGILAFCQVRQVRRVYLQFPAGGGAPALAVAA